VGKLGNCFASVCAAMERSHPPTKCVCVQTGGSVRESGGAGRAPPGAAVPWDTEGSSRVATCGGMNRAVGCGASEELQVLLFFIFLFSPEEGAVFCRDNGGLGRPGEPWLGGAGSSAALPSRSTLWVCVMALGRWWFFLLFADFQCVGIGKKENLGLTSEAVL